MAVTRYKHVKLARLNTYSLDTSIILFMGVLLIMPLMVLNS